MALEWERLGIKARLSCIIFGLGMQEFYLYDLILISVRLPFNYASNQINCILALAQLLSLGMLSCLKPPWTVQRPAELKCFLEILLTFNSDMAVPNLMVSQWA